MTPPLSCRFALNYCKNNELRSSRAQGGRYFVVTQSEDIAMRYNPKVLFTGSIILLFMSALHTHLFPAPLAFDWDINNAVFIVGVMSFILSLLLKPASGKKILFARLLLLPLIFSAFFCLLEISTEFDPHNISKGFGFLYFIGCYPPSFIGAALGLLVGWLIRRLKSRA